MEFRAYPTIGEKLIDKIKYKGSNFEFKYTNHLDMEDEIKIKEQADETINFRDANNRWVYKSNDLIIDKNIEFFTNPLFDAGGVVPVGSTLGVAISWNSAESKRRGLIYVGSFEYNSKDKNAYFSRKTRMNFDKNEIRNRVTIRVIIYLIKISDKIDPHNTFYATTPGTVLGELEVKTINFVGDGSIFPVVTIKDNDGPLWKLDIYDDNPEALVEEAIALVINENHNKYYLFQQGDKLNHDFIEEVMIEVVYQLILFADDLELVDEYSVGTVGYLISYYQRTYNLDRTNPSELYASVSKELRKCQINLF